MYRACAARAQRRQRSLQRARFRAAAGGRRAAPTA